VTIGVLGGGQLGRMLGLAARQLGIDIQFFDPSEEACSQDVGKLFVGQYEDELALQQFASEIDLCTYEFENVPRSAVDIIEKYVQVYPDKAALYYAQDRLFEKLLFVELGFETAEFYPVSSEDDLINTAPKTGFPALIKTRRFGYDGKGQVLLTGPDLLPHAWASVGSKELILEAGIPFTRELSQIAVRNLRGEIFYYPLIENVHADGILALSYAPAIDSNELAQQAQQQTSRLLNYLNYVGVITLEMFEHEGQLLCNEFAPRVHNSGHWTIEGAETNQFENHLRAIMDLPLGSTAIRGFCGMINLVGEIPEYKDVLSIPGVHLHLYGKEPRPFRKLGHITICSSTKEARDETLKSLWQYTRLPFKSHAQS
jgi:5-(carboxyamino)imidazole ribonucleotide synthase